MKHLIEYIKEALDVDNFAYKFDIWFESDKKHYEPLLNLLKDCSQRKVVSKADIESFLNNNPEFKVKKFVDFFDEDVKKGEDINVDYIYIFSKILETFITNFNLFNKLDYNYQASCNGEPNTKIEGVPLKDNEEQKKEDS